MDYFTSDLHLQHKFVLEHRGFSSFEEMHDRLFSMFDAVKKGDRVFILGDVAFTPYAAKELFDFLIMKKKVSALYIIEGNHDSQWLSKVEPHPRLHICQTMLLKGQKNGYAPIFLSHYPHMIFNKSHYGAYQLHGHGHFDTTDRPMLDALVMGKRINVNCELHDYKLWSRDEIEEEMGKLPPNIDQVLCCGTDEQKQKVIKMLGKINNTLKELYEQEI